MCLATFSHPFYEGSTTTIAPIFPNKHKTVQVIMRNLEAVISLHWLSLFKRLSEVILTKTTPTMTILKGKIVELSPTAHSPLAILSCVLTPSLALTFRPVSSSTIQPSAGVTPLAMREVRWVLTLAQTKQSQARVRLVKGQTSLVMRSCAISRYQVATPQTERAVCLCIDDNYPIGTTILKYIFFGYNDAKKENKGHDIFLNQNYCGIIPNWQWAVWQRDMLDKHSLQSGP